MVFNCVLPACTMLQLVTNWRNIRQLLKTNFLKFVNLNNELQNPFVWGSETK